MAEIINATFQDGAFVPEQEITSVAAGARVRLVVEAVDEADSCDPSSEATTSNSFSEACKKVGFRSGLRMTRDQLHERD